MESPQRREPKRTRSAGFIMLFGIYLVENGVITCEEFFETLKLQLRLRPALGALAIELRMLSASQVFSIMRSQCDAPADMFGELAVQAGHLNVSQLGQLVHEQSRRLRPFSELLYESGILPADVVAKHFRDYRWTMEHVEEPAPAAANC
jgi:hypothetical protein